MISMRRLAFMLLVVLAVAAFGATRFLLRSIDRPLEARSAVQEPSTRSVVLLAQFGYGAPGFSGYIQFLDAQSLEVLGRIRSFDPATQVKAVPGGKKLLISQGDVDGGGCCSLYLLDLSDQSMCRLIGPLADFAPSADGKFSFSQQGDTPVFIHDLDTGQPSGQIDAGVYTYGFPPSPNGKWLIGVKQFSLDGKLGLTLIDLQKRAIAGEAPITITAGAWIGESFWGLNSDDGPLVLRKLSPPDLLPTDVPLIGALPTMNLAVESARMISAGKNLLLYARINPWEIDSSREDIGRDTPGGAFLIDPTSGKNLQHLVPQADIADMASSNDGTTVYAIVAPDEKPVRLLAIDAKTGSVSKERTLEQFGDGRWSLTTAELNVAVIPHGEISPAVCRKHEATPWLTEVPASATPSPTAP